MNVEEALHSRTFAWRDPAATIAASRKRSGIELLRAIASGELPAPSMLVLLDAGIESIEPGRVVFTATPSAAHLNPMGIVHGGFASTLFDSALGCSITSKLAAGFGAVTLDLHVRFTRALRHDVGMLRCVGEVVHVGRTVGTAEAKLYDVAGKLYGHASTSCAIVAV